MNLPTSALSFVILACACLVPACTTPRAHDLAAGTARRMSETAKTCDALSDEIGQTTSALQSVVSNARSDPRESYVNYAHNVDSLAKLTEETRAARESLEREGHTYFAEWEKSNRTIGEESLRRTADQRKKDVQDAFTKTQRQLDGALESLGPFLSQLQDVRAYLSSDLSSAGIESMRGRIGDLGSKGRSIQKQLAAVDESVQKIMPDLGSRAIQVDNAEESGDGKVH
jgi:ABC-type transporter Mla subunit MlaD